MEDDETLQALSSNGFSCCLSHTHKAMQSGTISGQKAFMNEASSSMSSDNYNLLLIWQLKYGDR
jgi:hypothetical protein